MYCHQCGKEVGETNFCPYCGAKLKMDDYEPIHNNTQTPPPEKDAPNGGLAILSFFIPIVGLVLFIIWHKDFPLKAKSCLKGVVTGIICEIILVCCMFAAVGGAIGGFGYEEDIFFDDMYFNAVVETIPYESIH